MEVGSFRVRREKNQRSRKQAQCFSQVLLSSAFYFYPYLLGFCWEPDTQTSWWNSVIYFEHYALHLCPYSGFTLPSLCLPFTVEVVQNIQSQEPFLAHNHSLRTMQNAHTPCIKESSLKSRGIIVIILLPMTSNCWGLKPIFPKLMYQERDKLGRQERMSEVCTSVWPTYDYILYSIYSPLKYLLIFSIM